MNRKTRKPAFLIVIIVLAIILLINSFTFISRVTYKRKGYVNEYSQLMRSLEKEDYPYVADMVRENELNGRKTKEDTTEFKHFVVLYEAADLMIAYEKTGDEARALAQKEIVEEELSYISAPVIKEACDKILKESKLIN